MRPVASGRGAGGCHDQMGKQRLVPAVQELWNAWEIHCMIVASLLLQVVLFLFGGIRRRSSGWLLRTVLWLAYLSADSVAILVLGHLAVRASQPEHQLLPFWAPFVLVHLGGQDTISAYSKQDNELWRRHLLILLTQVAVAAYVVAKGTWPDRRLLAAVVLLFLCGCLKYGERTVILCLADPKLLRWSAKIVLSAKLLATGTTTTTTTTREEAMEAMSGTLQDMMSEQGCSCSSSALYWDAVTLVDDIISVDAPLNREQGVAMAADGRLPDMLKSFLPSKERGNAYRHVGAVLEHCYRRLYTKALLREAHISDIGMHYLRLWTKLHCRQGLFVSLLATVGVLILALFPCVSTSIALALFMSAEKGGQLQLHASRADITLSYSLLVGAIALDVCSVATFTFFHLRSRFPRRILYLASSVQPSCCKKQWSQELSQYNLITSAGMHPVKRFFALDVKPVTDDLPTIKKLILDALLVAGGRGEWNITSTRGRLALHRWMMQRHRHEGSATTTSTTTLKTLEETVLSSVDFPTSVLIWHIATDICYYSGGSTNRSDDQVQEHKKISRKLSNYVLYLVFKCGVMLTTNSEVVHDYALDTVVQIVSQTGQNNLAHKDAVMKLFEEAKKKQQGSTDENRNDKYAVMKNLNDPKHSEQDSTTKDEFQNNEPEASVNNADNAAQNHMKKLKLRTEALDESSVLPRACEVAQKLISIKHEAERWDLIASVWAEMLLYAAPRCGGDFHYERLSTGGEFVTHVLVLMYYLGPFLPPSHA